MDQLMNPKDKSFSDNQTKVIKIIIVIALLYVVLTIFGIQVINNEFKSYLVENAELILSVSIGLFTMIVFFSIFNIRFDEKNKKLQKEKTIETFNGDIDITKEDPNVLKSFETLSSDNINISFCQNSISSSEKDANCKKLTKGNCSTVGCCVLLNGEKCVGGNESGPTYLDEDGKDIDVQYYIHKDKCVGKGCPA
jgi:hypothetical protein